MAHMAKAPPDGPLGAYRNLTSEFMRRRDASRAHTRPFHLGEFIVQEMLSRSPLPSGMASEISIAKSLQMRSRRVTTPASCSQRRWTGALSWFRE